MILERTTDHGMNIGMRKMILVPKLVSEVCLDNEEVKVEVQIYNASRQRLRISKKTSIAKVYLGSREREFELKVSAAVLRWDTIFRNRN